MAKIVVIGAGVMGSALTVPACDKGHHVTLVGTPLDCNIIRALKSDCNKHPNLNAPLSKELTLLDIEELNTHHFDGVDFIVAGVSSSGLDWLTKLLVSKVNRPIPLVFVTKGLVAIGQEKVMTYADSIPQILSGSVLCDAPFIGIGGPCIARELALRQPTTVMFACSDHAMAHEFSKIMQTDTYRVSTSRDIIGTEACAALKNFYAIGVAAIMTQHSTRENKQNILPKASSQKGVATFSKNPLAAIFTQAVREISMLSLWFGGMPETACGLAGLGDLYVTVGGGRNSRFGSYLNEDTTLQYIMSGPMKGQTVEGIDTGRNLAPGLMTAFKEKELDAVNFPLAQALVKTIVNNEIFTFDFTSLGIVPGLPTLAHKEIQA